MTSSQTGTIYPQVIKLWMPYIHIKPKSFLRFGGFTALIVNTELTPRTVGEAFYNGELEDELRTIGKADHRFKYDSDREICMEMVEENRRETPYPH